MGAIYSGVAGWSRSSSQVVISATQMRRDKAARVGGNNGYQALPDDSRGCCDPVRARLSADPGPGIVILQRLRGAARGLVSAVLRRGGFGVGADRMVCEGFSGSRRGARR